MSSIHGLLLAGFAIYGALLLARWILARPWHWAAKFVALLMLAGTVASMEGLLVGAPADDLRIFTELLATGGAIAAATSAIRARGARRNRWVQYGVPALVLIFLAWTWWEQLVQLRDGTLLSPATTVVVAPPASAPIVPAPTAPADGLKSALCADPSVSPDRRRLLNCPPSITPIH